MKLIDITVYMSREWGLSPFAIKVKPSLKTQSFLFKLINDDYFITQLQELRSKYKIPKEGFSAKFLKNYKQNSTYQGTPQEMKEYKCVNGTYDIEPLWKKMKIDVKNIVNHYKYDTDYEWLFFLLITHNAFIEYDPKQHYFIKYFAGLIPIKAYLNIEEDPIAAIFIKNNITKEDFKKWIDENWNDSDRACIGPSLKAIMPKIPLERGTYKNIVVDETIVKLINKGKTNKQIHSSLCSAFSNNDFVYDYAWVNNRIARIKKRLHITTT